MRLARLPRSPSVVGGLEEDDPRVLAWDMLLLDASDKWDDTQVGLRTMSLDAESKFFGELQVILEQIRSK